MEEQLQIEIKNGVAQAVFTGEINLEQAGALKSELESTLGREKVEHLVLDLSGVTFIDSSGVGFLVGLNSRLKTESKAMYIYQPSRHVLKVLQLVQLLDFFQIVEHEDELLTILPE